MKNLIAELLVKLAQKEEEAKELTVQVEALEIVVTALLRHMEHDAQQALIQDIEQAIDQVTPCPPVNANVSGWRAPSTAIPSWSCSTSPIPASTMTATKR